MLSDIITMWASLRGLSPNLKSGSPTLAIFQSVVLCGLMFIQSQAVEVNELTRAATSNGPDLDSWNADFGFTRLPAVAATGQVQFSVRNVLTSNVLIKPGATVQTLDGTIQYQVVADTDLPGWSPSQNAYVLSAGQLSVNAAVQALNTGSASNVQAGALAQIASSITGISSVTNLAPIQDGSDPETDPEFRTRFKLFINSVNGKATLSGQYSAAFNTPGVKAVSIVENYDRYGNPRPGYLLIIIDDGSGNPPSSLIAAVTAAVQAVKGATIQFLVIGPVLSLVTVALAVKVAAGANSAAVVLNVENAVLDYVNGLEIGDTLYLENLSAIAKAADPNVIAVQAGSVLINSTAADFTATSQTVIRTDNTRTVIGTW